MSQQTFEQKIVTLTTKVDTLTTKIETLTTGMEAGMEALATKMDQLIILQRISIIEAKILAEKSECWAKLGACRDVS